MAVSRALRDDQILACHPVMVQLRPHVSDPAAFLSTVRSMQESDGYGLAALEAEGRVVAVAGFRVMHMLFRGRFLYVDDLVTDGATRSSGHGAALLAWLQTHARSEGCAQLVLDSGVQRKDAHRFYEREGMDVVAYNFAMPLDEAA